MSGGTPVGSGGYMRQRHSQGYLSSGDDLEDDASSKPPRFPVIHRAQTWGQVFESILWIASAAFIVYFGDWHSNMIYLLWCDNRIKRIPLYLGLASIFLNVAVIFFTVLSSRRSRKSYTKSELFSVAPLVAIVGFLSFFLFSFALWPIWSFLTLPLLFTLLMALMVISTYVPIGPLTPQVFVLRADRNLPL
uniref:Transmembrane protein 128 n=1 Tax=Anthurium amnicola TaxID=1678845 RepID=A0A1D1ZFZ9_9ARAE